jgi:hypothetical protein
MTHRGASYGWENGVGRLPLPFFQPAAEHPDGILAEWRATLFPPLPVAPYMSRRAEHDILTAKAKKFRGAQPRLHSKQDQSAIASPAPSVEIGRSK